MNGLLQVQDLIKNYGLGKNQIQALKGISFEVNEGDFVLIYGESGSGKSTALNIIGGMDRATSGKVLFYNRDITACNEKELNEYRHNYIGCVCQSCNLINNLSALDNILLVGGSLGEAIRLLDEMGLGEKANSFPSELPLGEAQRVAIARAVAKSPAMLLCDEPTGALDCENSRVVMEIIQKINRESGITVIMATRNAAFLPIANKVISLKSGQIESIVGSLRA